MARTRCSGMTLVESVLSVALFSTLMLAFSQALRLESAASDAERPSVELVMDLHDALHAMAEDLAFSGFTADGDYPYLFEDGDPVAAFALHAHAEPLEPVSEGESPSREVVFLLPDDAAGDGRPDFDADGDVVWSPVELSFVVVPDANGRNRLERRVDGSSGRVLCRGVESLVVDDTSTNPDVPLGCLRLELVASRDFRGRLFTERAEITVRLRNGGIRP